MKQKSTNKKNKTKKIQRAGLQVPVVYTQTDSNERWFDLFMENIDEVKVVGKGAYGVAVVVTSSSSQYRKNGQVVDNLLLKLLNMNLIKSLEQMIKSSDMEEDKENELKKLDMFDTEVETQIEFYSKTISKSLDDCLCPKIVYSSPNYVPPKELSEKLPETENLLHDGMTKMIAMEFMDSYKTLENVLDFATPEEKCLYLAMSMYTFIRFTYLTGKIHGDEHMGNIMIDTNANYFWEKSGKAILIDFGSAKDMQPEELQLFFDSYKSRDVAKLISILNLYLIKDIIKAYEKISLFNAISKDLSKEQLLELATTFLPQTSSFAKKLNLLNKLFLQEVLVETFNENYEKNNKITLQELLDDTSLELPDNLQKEILNNKTLSRVLTDLLHSINKRPNDSLRNLAESILTTVEKKILPKLTKEQLILLLNEISTSLPIESLTELQKEWKTWYEPLEYKVKELIESRNEFEDNTRSEITVNERPKPVVDNEITDEKCRKKCRWSFNKTKCLTKCKTKLNEVKDDMRLIDIATKNRRLCESSGYNCWSRRNFTPNQCKKKCAISLKNLNVSSKIEPTIEYAKFINHLYSKNPTFLCNKLFVQYIENSESIKELIGLLNRGNNVLKHEDYLELNKLIGNFKPQEHSDNIEVLKQNIEQAKQDMDCVKLYSQDVSSDLSNGFQKLTFGGYRTKKVGLNRKGGFSWKFWKKNENVDINVDELAVLPPQKESLADDLEKKKDDLLAIIINTRGIFCEDPGKYIDIIESEAEKYALETKRLATNLLRNREYMDINKNIEYRANIEYIAKVDNFNETRTHVGQFLVRDIEQVMGYMDKVDNLNFKMTKMREKCEKIKKTRPWNPLKHYYLYRGSRKIATGINRSTNEAKSNTEWFDYIDKKVNNCLNFESFEEKNKQYCKSFSSDHKISSLFHTFMSQEVVDTLIKIYGDLGDKYYKSNIKHDGKRFDSLSTQLTPMLDNLNISI